MPLNNIPTENLDPWLISWELDEEMIAILTENAELMEVPARTNVFSEGDDAGAMYFVLSGMVLVLKTDEHGHEETVSIIVEQQSFGEVGLMVNQPRLATVAAGIDCKILKITPDTLTTLEQNQPDLVMHIYKNLARSFAEQWVEMMKHNNA